MFGNDPVTTRATLLRRGLGRGGVGGRRRQLRVRLEQRRSLLDAVVAAGDRVIITCTGRNVKNNVLTPLVTPLAELVELCGELGAGRNRHNKDLSAVEVLHPRHFNSTPNFVKGRLVDGLVWSHSSAALRAASAQAPKPESSVAVKGLDLEALQVVPVEMLEKVVHDPLRVYVRDTLHINTWRDDRQDDPATVPLSISKRDTALLAESLLVTLRSGGTVESWERAAVLGGELPPGCFRAAELAGVKAFVDDLRTALNEWTSVSVEDVEIRIDLGDGRVIRGTVPNVHTRADGTCFVLTPCFSEREYVTARSTVPLHMILLAAAGRNVTDGPIPSLHADGGKVARRNIRPATDLQQDACITRLRNLVSLLETARSMPCPSFDGAGILAVTDRDAAADKFQACVEGHGYSWSDEALVHGFSPFFDDVFPEDSPLIGFWAAHDANAPHAADGKNNVPKGWRRFEFA